MPDFENINVEGQFIAFFVLAGLLIIIVLWIRLRCFRWATLRRIDRMEGVEFERYLAYCFRKQGYRVSLTRGSSDFGADLILYGEEGKIAVQAKRYGKPVGVAAVQQVLAAKDYYECDLAMVVTNTQYTRQARELADKSGVHLLEREDLIRLMKREKRKKDMEEGEIEDSEWMEVHFDVRVYHQKKGAMNENNINHILIEALRDHGYEID